MQHYFKFFKVCKFVNDKKSIFEKEKMKIKNLEKTKVK
jgi:hypothetical protein